jgi:drug/metabolite transporter (DMT)-like permease
MTDTRESVRRLAPMLLLVLGTLWGFNTSIMKLAGIEGIPPVGLTTLQMTGAGVVLYLFCRWKGLGIGTDKAHLLYYFHTGVLGTAIPSVNLVNTLRELPAGVMVLAIATVPLIVYGASLVLRMERFDLPRFCGVLLGLAGVFLIVLPETSLPDPQDADWFLIGMITPIFYSYSAIAAARFRPEGAASVPLAAGMVVAVAILIWPTAFLVDQVYVPNVVDPDLATLCILIAIGVTCVAYFLYFELIRAIGPVGISVVGYIVTLTGMVFGMIFFDETYSAWVWAAAALIFAGLALVNGRQAAGALMGKVRG